MKYATTILITLCLCVFATPVRAAQHPRIDECRGKEVRRLVLCLARNFDAPGSPRYALRIASCESGLYPRATNGSHMGLFQQARTYWPGRYRSWGAPLDLGSSAFNPITNSVVSLRQARQAGTWQRDWSCA